MYHGSKNNLVTIMKNQATKADSIEVPKNELLDGIYLTPDYGFALACAIRPDGVTTINNENKSIIFENPELFNPEQEVFVYEIEVDNILKENIIKIDERQCVIVGIDELNIFSKFTHKAKDV